MKKKIESFCIQFRRKLQTSEGLCHGWVIQQKMWYGWERVNDILYGSAKDAQREVDDIRSNFSLIGTPHHTGELMKGKCYSICKDCGKTLPISSFYMINGEPARICAECTKAQRRKETASKREKKISSFLKELPENKEWRSIPGFEAYIVSTCGDIVSINTRFSPKILKPHKDKGGYLCVSLRKDRQAHLLRVHRAVAMAFLPTIEGKTCVNHIDGNKENNNKDNLEWASPSENNKHMYSVLGYHGSLFGVTGGEHPGAHAIIQKGLDGSFIKEWPSMVEAANFYGAKHPAPISAVCRGKTKTAYGFVWEYVDPPHLEKGK